MMIQIAIIATNGIAIILLIGLLVLHAKEHGRHHDDEDKS